MAKRRDIVLRFLAEPADVNFGGKVHGGAVMKWIDQCGYACAAGWSGRYCVTVSVSNIRFTRPIFVGHLVEVLAVVAMTGNTSMHIKVRVSSSDPKDVDLRDHRLHDRVRGRRRSRARDAGVEMESEERS